MSLLTLADIVRNRNDIPGCHVDAGNLRHILMPFKSADQAERSGDSADARTIDEGE
jgi:hypothetical protein